MQRSTIKEKLEEKGYLRHDIATVMLAIPQAENALSQEKLTECLEKNRFPIHEIVDICKAVFN